jgi:hypothetical protein
LHTGGRNHVTRSFNLAELVTNEIPAAEETWIKRATDRFEHVRKHRSRPRLGGYLAETEESQRRQFLAVLTLAELEPRGRAGEDRVPDLLRVRSPPRKA